MNFSKSILLIAVLGNISSYSFASEEDSLDDPYQQKQILAHQEEQNLVKNEVRQNIRENLIPDIDNSALSFQKHYSYEKAVEMLEKYLQSDMKQHAEHFLIMISNHQFDDQNGTEVGSGVVVSYYGMSTAEVESRNKEIMDRLKNTINAAAKGEHVHNKEKTQIQGLEITNLAEPLEGESSSEESQTE